MRIIGGALGGRRFSGPPGKGTRPTPDRVREALASALDARGAIEDASVLDLFAGSGGLGFEMLSRGARTAVAVEGDRRVAKALERSARELGLDARLSVLCLDLLGRPERAAERLSARPEGPFSLVFADAPYRESDRVPALLVALTDAGALTPETLVVLEHATKAPPELPERLVPVASYQYGDTSLSLLKPARPGGSA